MMHESELRQGLNEIARQAVPSTINLWPSIQSRLSAPQNKPRVIVWSRIVISALILAVVISTFAIISRPQPVSAAEILNRAVQVTQSAAASGIQSYQGVIDETHQETGFTSLVSHWQTHVWVQAPGSFRAENFGDSPYVVPNRIPANRLNIISAPIPPLDVNKAALANLAVSDGITTWQVDTGIYNVAVEYAADDFEAFSASYFLGAFLNPRITNPSDIQEAIQRLSSNNSSVVFGQNTVVAGRPAYTIQLNQKKDDLYLSALTFTIWVDRETYLALGYEERTETGDLLRRAAFTTININQPIDASVFRYTPPSEVKTVDLRPDFPLSPADLAEDWEQVKTQWGSYPIYLPTYVPDSFVSDHPQFSTEIYPVIFSPPNVIQRFYMNGVHMITIRQSIEARLENWGTDEYTVHVGPYTGELYVLSDRPKTLILHAVDQNDIRTDFLITADASLSKDELLKIAASLQEIPDLSAASFF